MLSPLFRIATFGIAALAFSLSAFADPIVIEANKSTSLKLNGSAASVVIGNPRVADVAVHDANLIFITGRTFGTTNLLVFSESGEQIYSGDVVVTTNTTNLVNVNRAYREITVSNGHAPPAWPFSISIKFTSASLQIRNHLLLPEAL